MANSREVDSRKKKIGPNNAIGPEAAPPMNASMSMNALTGSPKVVTSTGEDAPDQTLIGRALSFMRNQSNTMGFAAEAPAEFAADPMIPRTSAGARIVNLKQMFRGLTVFQMTRSVRFSPAGKLMDATGDTAAIPDDFNIEPKLSVEDAVLHGAQHLASTGVDETIKDDFGQEYKMPSIHLEGFAPQVTSGFPLPSRPSVLDRGPFENPIPAHLLIFMDSNGPRLGWYIVYTFPDYTDQYIVIVAADPPEGEILYCKSTMSSVGARGNVFEFSPAISARKLIDFPRPIADFPAMPSTPISGFPADWVGVDRTDGNACLATLNFSSTTLLGVSNGGTIQFSPTSADGDEQKLLNIFYFCNYMHDFLYILGFDEAVGNFQQINFTHLGTGGDRVRARAHSGTVQGTANMSTGPDGLPPVMNMGIVSSTSRHTAFDSDVVFHEYTHGLTNRMVMGGRLNAPHSLSDAIQSGGMGEGWSDYYALTIFNFFHSPEKTVVGDWVIQNPAGIRRAPYDDAFPFNYGDLQSSPEVHDIGEVWCATLMSMTRKIRSQIGNDQQGYRLAWQIVTDGLKLTPATPTFLEARNAILQAIEDLASVNHINPATHTIVKRAAWQAFAHFGMGIHAASPDPDDVNSIVADFTLPPGL